MTKSEFLEELKCRLSELPDYEIEKTVSFYAECIDDRIEEGMTEEEAVSALGNIDDIVNGILIDTPLPSLVQNKIKVSHKTSKNKTLWMILAICGFPFWFMIGMFLLIMILAVYISIWSVIIALFAIVFSFVIGGIGGLISGIIACFTKGPAVGFTIIGISIICIGLFLLLLKPMFWICKKLIKLTGLFLRKIKSLFMRKKEG